MTKFTGYVGTYTKGDSKGIYTFTLDTDHKTLSNPSLAAELENPTYVAISEDNSTLYAVVKQGDNGGVAAYSIDPETSTLQFINQEISPGVSPCHVSVDKNKQAVLAGYYHRGTVDLFNTNGLAITPAVSTVQHTGHGPNQERQEKPHVHYVNFTPDEQFVIAVDLGIDQIKTYSMDDDQLIEVNSLSVKPGSGPRHMAFHPNGKYAYVMTELSNEVITLAYNQEDGSFTELQYITTIPTDFTENSQGSAIHLSQDGRFLYAGNRGHNSIALFSIHQETGKLTFIEYTLTNGEWPRDFVMDPTEQFLVASNQESHNLVLFARDKITGKLSLLPSTITVPYPVCVKFLSINHDKI
jgi:6-phosphogluconolactonase